MEDKMKPKNAKICVLLLLSIVFSNTQGQTVKDIDGNIYQTATIGSQIWMKENLKVTKYRNGDIIGTTSSPSISICADTLPKYQWAFDGNDSLVTRYGRLYTWFTVTDKRNVCPTGWHLPHYDEWKKLKKQLGVDTLDRQNIYPILINFNVKDTPKDNLIGHKGAERGCGGTFSNQESMGYYWSSTIEGNRSRIWGLGSDIIGFPIRSYNEEWRGYSVRCLKD
jgi:uncharacterized protein (TIGR02145 family)